MEDASEEYFTSIIKVEAEEFEHDWVRDQELIWVPHDVCNVDQESTVKKEPACFVQEGHGAGCAVYQPVLAQTMPSDVPTKRKRTELTPCKMKNCTWFTEEQDPKVTFSLLKQHVRACHKQITDICDKCYKMYSSKSGLASHILQTHGSFPCRFCAYKLNSVTELEAHFKKCHNIQDMDHYNHLLKSFEKVPKDIYIPGSVAPKKINTEVSSKNSEGPKNFDTKIVDPKNFGVPKNSDTKIVPPKNLGDFHILDTEIMVPKNIKAKFVTPKTLPTFTCELCQVKFYSTLKLKEHYNNFHSISTDINMDWVTFTGAYIKKMCCKKCSTSFVVPDALRKHYLVVHKQRIPKNITRYTNLFKYSCQLCTKYNTINMTTLKEHYVSEHNIELDLNVFDLSSYYTAYVSELSKEEGKYIFSCRLCSDVYSNFYDLCLHTMEIHHKYLCSKCKTAFDTIESQKLHFEEVHTGCCKICDYKSFNWSELMSHVANSHSEIVDITDEAVTFNVKNASCYHVCKLCEKSLSLLENMRMHYFWYHHHYTCEFCNSSFESLGQELEHFESNHCTECIHCRSEFSDLQSHLNLCHSNEKYAMCESCGENLNTRDELRLHRLKHKIAGKKDEFQCPKCSMKCKTRRRLKLHMNCKHLDNPQVCGDFCKLCDKKFKNIGLHMYWTHNDIAASGTNKKLYKCHNCKKVYFTLQSMKRHLKIHASKELD